MVRNAEGELERARLAARDRLRIELIEKALLAGPRRRPPAGSTTRTNTRLVNETVDDLSRGKR